MSQEEKIDVLLKKVESLEESLKKQDEQLDYIVARLNHMRDRAHQAREDKTAWPK